MTPSTMRAIVQHGYGGSEVLRMASIPIPEPGRDRVRIRVQAAGVAMGDWHMRAGEPLAMRVISPRGPRSTPIGFDVAGIVDAVGPGVEAFSVGDRVMGEARGSFAEFALARIDRIVRIPEGVAPEDAAAAPVSGTTALHALAKVGDIAGRRVLVSGAGGGVGSFAVQLATLAGARVTGVCSARKAEFVRRLGADRTIDYAVDDPSLGPDRYKAILDFAGNRPVGDWRRVLEPDGLIVLGGGEGGGRLLGMAGRALGAAFDGIGRRRTTVGLVGETTVPELAVLASRLADGSLRSPVTRVAPLADAGAVIDDLAAGRVTGKAVLTP